MAHVITPRCVKCKYTDCCTVCPVDCFYEVDEPAMLVIDPDTCIDCELCVTECPVHAIYPEDELPEVYAEWLDKNRDLTDPSRNVTTKTDPHPEARTLEEIQAEEKAKGWDVPEPTKAE
jgi:ferredoxin